MGALPNEAVESGAVPDPALRARVEAELRLPVSEALLDPLALERLAALTAEVTRGPHRDPDLASRLLSRRALLSGTGTTARDLADRAVELARAARDRAALVAALGVRAALVSADDSACAAARDLIATAELAGELACVVDGHALLADAALSRGDPDVAAWALDRMTTLAVLLDSPEPSRSAGVRRVGLLAYRGDYDAARAQIDELAGTHAGVPERDLRLSLALIFGRSLTAAERALFAAPARSPQAQLQAALLGDAEAAAYWLGHIDAAHQGPQALANLVLLARLAWSRTDRAAAAEVRPLLGRYAGLLPPGPVLDLPADWHLARLALLLRDSEAAVRHAEAAVDLAQRMRSSMLRAWALQVLARAQGRSERYAEAAVSRDLAAGAAAPAGVLLPPELVPGVDAGQATLTRCDSGWSIRSPLGGGVVPGLVGMAQLARLLADAEPVSAAALDGVLPVPRTGRALSDVERRRYSDRLLRLWRSGRSDPRRSAEEATVLGEVRRLADLEHQESPGAVLVPQRVGHNLRRAIEAIGAVAPELGAHLRVSVRTREWCRYEPPPNSALHWRVESGDRAGGERPGRTPR